MKSRQKDFFEVNRWLPGALYILVVLIFFIPILAVDHYLTLDGPAHVQIADALARYHRVPIFREFYELSQRLQPNYLIYWIMSALRAILSPGMAEKALQLLYLTSFACAGWYLMGGIDRRARYMALLLLPLAYPWILKMGFYNLVFGVVIFMAFIGYWLRHHGHGGPAEFIVYGLLTALALTTHLFAVAAILLAIGLLTFGHLVSEWVRRPNLRSTEIVAGQLWRSFLPALWLLPAMIWGMGVLETDTAFVGAIDEQPVLQAPTLSRLLTFGAGIGLNHRLHALDPAAQLYMLTLVYCGFRILRRPDHDAGWLEPLLFAFFGFFVFYQIIPEQYHARWMPYRLAPFVYILMVAWLATRIPQLCSNRVRPVRKKIIVAACLLALVGNTIHTVYALEADRYVKEYLSVASRIPPGSTLLAMRLSWKRDGGNLLLQTGGYLAAASDSVELKNYQLHSGIAPVFYRTEFDPYRHLATDGGFVSSPPDVQPSRYKKNTGQPINWVLLWGKILPDANTRLGADLAQHYTLAYRSETGLTHLYRLQATEQTSQDLAP
jgi:hypothetical protein